jgi:hypothetical protein
MFFAANALLFRLYLPSRFTVHSFRILLAIAAGISTIVLLDTVFRWAKKQPFRSGVRQVAALASVGLVAAVLAVPFVTGPVVDTRYKFGENPELYEFLARQPKDVLIASLANDVENLPMFARRSILVGRETALPFHKKYYSQIRERAVDLINAQYSTDIAELRNFIQKYRVSFVLVDRNAFTPQYVAGDKWVMQYQPAAKDAVARLKQGEVPALSTLIDRCSVLETNGMSLIPAECILESNSSR